MLTKILKNQLPLYRELYKNKSSNYAVTYGLIDHFIRRFEKYPEWEEKVSFLTLKDSSTEDATFAMVNDSFIYFDSLESSPHFDNAQSLLNNLDLDCSSEKVFVGIRDNLRSVVQNFIRSEGLKQTFDTSSKTIISKFSKAELEEMTSKPSEGYYYESLKESDAEEVNENWISKFPGSLDFIKTQIKFNPSTGLYKSNGELIAWMLFTETGALTPLQVKREYKNLPTDITKVQTLKVLNENRIPFTHALKQELKYFDPLLKQGKAEIAGTNSWIGMKDDRSHEKIYRLQVN